MRNRTGNRRKLSTRLAVMGAVAVASVGLCTTPAAASANNCTDGFSTCIDVSGSGLNVTQIKTVIAATDADGTSLAVTLRITYASGNEYQYGTTHFSGMTAEYVWSAWAGTYPNGTKLCTTSEISTGWACATVHT